VHANGSGSWRISADEESNYKIIYLPSDWLHHYVNSWISTSYKNLVNIIRNIEYIRNIVGKTEFRIPLIFKKSSPYIGLTKICLGSHIRLIRPWRRWKDACVHSPKTRAETAARLFIPSCNGERRAGGMQMCWISEPLAKTRHTNVPDRPRLRGVARGPSTRFAGAREHSPVLVNIRHSSYGIPLKSFGTWKPRRLRDLAAPSSGDIATGMEKINANAYE